MNTKITYPIQGIKNRSLSDLTKFSLSISFVLLVFLWAYFTYANLQNNTFLIIGAVLGAYMAMNIGANDVANNVGPAVGSKALTLVGAIFIAIIFESLGAFIAGEEVVKTIKDGIINPDLIPNPEIFIWVMTSSLLSAALWLNFATSIEAPVSATHSIVGGVMGAGIAAAGFSIVNWATVVKIAISWIISPLLGGIVAAVFLYFIKKQIIYKNDVLIASNKFVPILIAFMAWAFSTYIILKGLKSIININFFISTIIGLVISIGIYFIIKPLVKKASLKLINDRTSLNTLFNIPLIFAAALLSFAHGANDVANAIGPLAAINDAIINSDISSNVSIPFWVMAIGAIGIVVGLTLYGPKLIKTVGSEITELDQIRAYSIAMATAVTVILASQFGLPVSSTHIAIGAVFGVGFLREFLDFNEKNILKEIRRKFKTHKKEYENIKEELDKLQSIQDKSKTNYIKIVELYKNMERKEDLIKDRIKQIKDAKSTSYVKRDAIKKIVAAWIITVPVAAILSAAIFYMLKGIML